MTPATLTESEAKAEYRLIDIDLIRDPHAPARETMDEAKMLELVDSIMKVGLIEPVVVKDLNDHFEVIAGHRRTMACRAAGLMKIPCIIRAANEVSDLAIMIHENAVREDMNPVEEGRFYLRALEEECEGDVDKLCAMLHRNRDYVEGRVLLLQGYPNVIAALEQGHITIAVSKLLNKVEDPNRLLLLLDQAMAGGANARMVAQWVTEANAKEPILLPPSDPEADAAALAAAAQALERSCIFCGSSSHPELLETITAHNICFDNFRAAQAQVHQHNSD